MAGSVVIFPPLFLVDETLNLTGRVLAAAVHAATAGGGFVPGIGTLDVMPPERPRAALVGAYVVYRTGLYAIMVVEENAILGGSLFDDGHSPTDSPEVFFFEVMLGNAKEFGDSDRLLAADPDIAFAGTGTTPATLGTFETEPGLIP
jgi:hypothetical protein